MHKFRKELVKRYNKGEISFNVFSTMMQITLAADAAVCGDCGEFDINWYNERVDLLERQLAIAFADPEGNVTEEDWDTFRDLEYEFNDQVLIPE